MYRLPADKELTLNKLGEFLMLHNSERTTRLKELLDAYMSDYPIYHQKEKAKWKPDNRIGVNFAKYITDTMNGFFIGIPVKITCEDQRISDYVKFFDTYNDQDDKNAELSKLCEIFGHGYELYYVDDHTKICSMYVSPMDGFMIYDDSVIGRERYFVRTYVDADNVLRGSVSDETTVRYFVQKGRLEWTGEEKLHGFDGVPASEFLENKEKIGIYESVLPMINHYNKALSEKANDVDYFADAYMKVLGALLDEKGLANIRDNRIINFDDCIDGVLPEVEFLQKPNGDTTQENLIDRLEKLIFQISMVANISDENFGTSSGIAMSYKLQAMKNLFQTKVRKFTSGMNRRYRLVFSNPVSGMNRDDWMKLSYQFTPNLPANVSEEAQTAQTLEGIVSKETQLKVLSIVDNAENEIGRMRTEEKDGKSDILMQHIYGDESSVSAKGDVR